MNCETCQNELEDFLYGELDDARAHVLRSHLRTCSACAQQQAALEREHEIFSQYYEQTAPEPSDALWRAVQTRIRQEARVTPTITEASVSWWRNLFVNTTWLRQTAFATALVLLSVAATTLYLKRQAQPNNDTIAHQSTPTPQPPVTIAPTPTPVELIAPKTNSTREARPQPQLKLSEDQLLQNQMARAEREYQQAIKLLDRVIARRRDQLDPAVREQYASSLALIDNSIAESRRALRGEPSNAMSGQFLLAAYAKKLELMRDIAMNAGQ